MPDIEIDTSRLSFPTVEVVEAATGPIDGSATPPPAVPLPAGGGYHLGQGAGVVGAFEFEVREDGTVDFDEAFDGFLSGRGSRRLTVRGHRVDIDLSALSHDLPPLDVPGAERWLSHEEATPLMLLPADGYGFRATPNLVPHLRFGLSPDGHLSVGPSPRARVRHGQVLAQALHVVTQWLIVAGVSSETRLAAAEAIEGYRQWSATPGVVVATVASRILAFSSELDRATLLAESVAAAGTAVQILRQSPPPPAAPAHHRRVLAQALHVLTMQLALAERFTEARLAAVEAIEGYRQWAATPGVHVPTVVGGLRSFASKLDGIGLRAESTAAIHAAAELLRQLPPTASDADRAPAPGGYMIEDYRRWADALDVDATIPAGRPPSYPAEPEKADADGEPGAAARALHGLTRRHIVAGRIEDARAAAVETIDAYGQWAASIGADVATITSGMLSFSSELNRVDLRAESVAAARAAARVLRKFPPPDFSEVAEAAGNILRIQGRRITVDGTNLAHDLLPLGLGGEARWLPRATKNDLVVIPGRQYGFQAGFAAIGTWRFGVALDGSVVLPPGVASFAKAKDSTLTIHGHLITIDGTKLSFDLLPLPPADAFLPRTQPNDLVLMPAKPYMFQGGSVAVGSWGYEVALDGTVVVDPAFGAFATALGNKLTVRGHEIEIKGTDLSHDLLLLPVGLPFLSRRQVNKVVLMPSRGYVFQAGNAAVGNWRFEVALDGTVVVDPAFSAFATAVRNRLTVVGYGITIDGQALSSSLLPLPPSEPRLPRTRRHELRLMPARWYTFQVGSVVGNMTYDVRVDGTVDFPPSCDGFLRGRGTNTLEVLGYPVAIDATHADSDLVGIVNAGVSAQAPRELFAVLLPGRHYVPRTTRGNFATPFAVTQDGRVVGGEVPPSAGGFYVGKASTSPNPSTVGEEVTVEVTVRAVHSGSDTPRGSVSLASGATVLASGSVSPHGTAILRTAALGPGEHDLVVTYGGNEHFLPSSTQVPRHRVMNP